LIAAVVTLGVAEAFSTSNRPLVTIDLYAFDFWSVLFAVVVGIVSRVFASGSRQRSPLFRYLLGGITGLLAGFGFSLLVALSIGPRFGVFGPELLLWMLGGLCGVLFAVKVVRGVEA
jgi:hypothetical protein